MKSTEDKIRTLMRNFDIKCPSCGTDCLSTNIERDLDTGIMDEIICADCDSSFEILSVVHTEIIQ